MDKKSISKVQSCVINEVKLILAPDFSLWRSGAITTNAVPSSSIVALRSRDESNDHRSCDYPFRIIMHILYTRVVNK